MVTLKVKTADGQTQTVTACTYSTAWDLVNAISDAVRVVDGLNFKYAKLSGEWFSL